MVRKSLTLTAKTLMSIILLFAGVIVSGILLQVIPGDLGWSLLSTPIGLGLSAYLMYLMFERKLGWKIGWKDRKWAARLLTGGVAAAVIISTSTAIILLTGTVELGLNEWSTGAILFQLFLFLAIAVSEEWFFRGYLYGLYRQTMSTRLAILLNSVIFTAIHLINPDSLSRPMEHIVLEMVNIFLLSIFMSQARVSTGTIWLPISLHFMFNFFQSTIFGFVNGGKEVESISELKYLEPNVWNGSEYGLESSLIFTPILICAIMVYGYYQRRMTSKNFELQA